MPLAFPHAPERGNAREFLFHPAGRDALQAVDQLGQADLGRVVHQQMDVVLLAVELAQLHLEVFANIPEYLFQPFEARCVEYLPTPFRDEHQVRVENEDNMPSFSHIHGLDQCLKHDRYS